MLVGNADTLEGRAALMLESSELSAETPVGRPVGRTTPDGIDVIPALICESSELSAGSPVGRTPDGKLLMADTLDGSTALLEERRYPGKPSNTPVGRTTPEGRVETPPLITESSELRPGARDGRLGTDVAPALMLDINELNAAIPESKTLDGSAPICDISELSAGALDGKMPVGSVDTPDGRTLIWERIELKAGTPTLISTIKKLGVGTAPEESALIWERIELKAGTLDATLVGIALTLALIFEISELSTLDGILDGKTDGRLDTSEDVRTPGIEVTPALISESSELSSPEGKPDGRL